ncbi:MAG: hypothetical protein V1858_05105 [Candidatus Gottesmanbacteria bacterium]
MGKTLPVILFNLFDSFLTFITAPFYVFLILEVTTVAFMVVIGIGAEKILIWFIANTPTLGINGRGTFDMGIEDVVKFFSFWSIVIFILLKIAEIIIKIRIPLKAPFAILTILHIMALLKFWNQKDMYPVIFIFYFFAGLSLTILILKRKLHDLIYKFNDLNNSPVVLKSSNQTNIG